MTLGRRKTTERSVSPGQATRQHDEGARRCKTTPGGRGSEALTVRLSDFFLFSPMWCSRIFAFCCRMASPSSQSSIGARSQGVGRGQGSAGSRSASLGQRHRELFIKAALSLGAFGTLGVAAAKNEKKQKTETPFAHTYGCPPQPPSEEAASSSRLLRRLGPSVGWVPTTTTTPWFSAWRNALKSSCSVRRKLREHGPTTARSSGRVLSLSSSPPVVHSPPREKQCFVGGCKHKLLARGCRTASCSGPTERKAE